MQQTKLKNHLEKKVLREHKGETKNILFPARSINIYVTMDLWIFNTIEAKAKSVLIILAIIVSYTNNNKYRFV